MHAWSLPRPPPRHQIDGRLHSTPPERGLTPLLLPLRAPSRLSNTASARTPYCIWNWEKGVQYVHVWYHGRGLNGFWREEKPTSEQTWKQTVLRTRSTVLTLTVFRTSCPASRRHHTTPAIFSCPRPKPERRDHPSADRRGPNWQLPKKGCKTGRAGEAGRLVCVADDLAEANVTSSRPSSHRIRCMTPSGTKEKTTCSGSRKVVRRAGSSGLLQVAFPYKKILPEAIRGSRF